MGSLTNGHTIETNGVVPPIKNVAIIGAGISGITSAAHLTSEGLKVTLFERSGVIGGAWVYDARIDRDLPFPSTLPPKADWNDVTAEGLNADDVALSHAPPGPCYAGLKNNVPTTLMRSSLLRWPEGTQEFIDQTYMRRYVEDIARIYGVIDKIVFHTRVEDVSKPEGARSWSVTTTTLSRTETEHAIKRRVHEFDAVVVASGHYHIPFIPDIPGVATWKECFPDRVIHSKRYRTPDVFAGKRILLIGAGASALDISKEVDELGGKVYLARRESKFDLAASRIPPQIERVTMVADFVVDEDISQTSAAVARESNGHIPGKIVLSDRRLLEDIDYVVFATGYITSYPFLGELEQPLVAFEDADDKVLITSDGYATHNLHKDIFYIPDPSLAFVGVSHLVSTFSLFDFQAKVVAKVFAGLAHLPPRPVMREEHRRRKARFRPGDKFHSMLLKEDVYIAEVLEWVNRDLRRAGKQPMVGMDDDWHAAYKLLKERSKVFQPAMLREST